MTDNRANPDRLCFHCVLQNVYSKPGSLSCTVFAIHESTLEDWFPLTYKQYRSWKLNACLPFFRQFRSLFANGALESCLEGFLGNLEKAVSNESQAQGKQFAVGPSRA